MTTTVTTVAGLNAAIVAADEAAANSGTIEIDISGTIDLGSTALDAINLASGVTLDIVGSNNAEINGGGTEQGFFVYSGTVNISNLTIQNTLARGGNGASGGGGGAGFGGGLFIANNATTGGGGYTPGNVTLNNVTFSNDSAQGGNGSAHGQSYGGGGGDTTSGIGGAAGFGGGNSATSALGGGGGLGAGGDIFVMQGATLTIEGGTAGAGAVTGGSGGSGGGAGSAFGDGIFLQGNETITLGTGQIAGQTTIISGAIADEHGSVPSDANKGSLLINGLGTVDLSAPNTFAGGMTLASGTLELGNASAAGSGAITFNGTAALKLDANITIANTLTNMAIGDAIDLSGVSYQSGATATYSSRTLTVNDGSATESFTLATPSNTTFTVQSDGHGGTLVTDAVAPVITYTPETLTSTIGSPTPVNPLAKVTIADANPGATDKVIVAVSGPGTLSDGGSYHNLTPDGSAGTTTFYEISGLSAAAATSELDALVFTPGSVAVNSSETSLFYVGAQSSTGTSAQTASAVPAAAAHNSCST